MPTQADRNELCRKEVLALLAGMPSIAFQATTIQRRLAPENRFYLPEVTDALNFLLDAKLVKAIHNPLGASLAYQATHEGVLHYERSF